jgi:AcrR family transcriptional regulator
MPRTYRLGRRAEQQAETRRRILEAALGLYRQGGYAAATTVAVADAADVARATVRNHFPTPLDLAVAAGDQVLDDLRPPDPSMFDGLASTADRVERLARELVAFFERGEPWWSVLQRDADLARAWTGAAEAYETGYARLLRGALGPLADDPVAVAVTSNTVGPPLHYALRSAGLSPDDAVDAQLSVILPWLERRESPSGRERRQYASGGHDGETE